MKEFSCTTRIVMGQRVQEVLKEQNFQKILVVSDPFFAKNGTAQLLGQQAQAFAVFDQIAPDPSLELVAQGTARLLESEPDALVALGGGSAMDCAKAMRFFAGKDIPLIAVPSTSGSGSEVTDFAILTHKGVKHPLVDEALRPTMAILDRELVRGLPPALVAEGGFDAMAHALEAWVGENASPITDALALEAFRRIYTQLGASFGGDQMARHSVHEASTMAGLAFNRAGLGVCHALAHALGGQFHIPHGRLNAILLPEVIAHNGAVSRYAELCRQGGLFSGSDTMVLRNLRNGLVRLRRQLGLPGTLVDAGIDPAMLQQKKQAILETALKDPCCQTNPIPVTQELLACILQEASGVG